jgi:hypothetical protein
MSLSSASDTKLRQSRGYGQRQTLLVKLAQVLDDIDLHLVFADQLDGLPTGRADLLAEARRRLRPMRRRLQLTEA